MRRFSRTPLRPPLDREERKAAPKGVIRPRCYAPLLKNSVGAPAGPRGTESGGSQPRARVAAPRRSPTPHLRFAAGAGVRGREGWGPGARSCESLPGDMGAGHYMPAPLAPWNPHPPTHESGAERSHPSATAMRRFSRTRLKRNVPVPRLGGRLARLLDALKRPIDAPGQRRHQRPLCWGGGMGSRGRGEGQAHCPSPRPLEEAKETLLRGLLYASNGSPRPLEV